MAQNVIKALEGLTALFESGAVFSFIGPALIIDPKSDRPMNHWSLWNRIWAMYHGTSDARGFRQWEAVGRHVKKGAKAIYILAPILKPAWRESDEKPGEKERFQVCIGFRDVPVFRKEDTEGAPLGDYAPTSAPPLTEVAKAWGLEVFYEASVDGHEHYYGFYQHGAEKNITLLTHDTYTWLHELVHAAHDRLGTMQNFGKVDREIVAEFGAAALARVLGLSNAAAEESAIGYCQHYANATGNPTKALMGVLDEVQKVCDLILTTAAATADAVAA